MGLNKTNDKMTTKHIYKAKLVLILSFITFFGNAYALSKDSLYSVKMDIYYEKSRPGDTIFIEFNPVIFYDGLKFTEKSETIVDTNGIAHFNILQRYPYGYIDIVKTRQEDQADYPALATNLFWESGDSISIHIDQPLVRKNREYYFDTTFKGINAAKYKTIYELKKAYRNIQWQRREERNEQYWENDKFQLGKPNDLETINELLTILERNKQSMSNLSYGVIKTDIQMIDFEFVRRPLLNIDIANLNQTSKDSLDIVLRARYLPVPRFVNNQDALASSGNLVNFYTNLFYILGKLRKEYQEIDVAKDIVNNTGGKLSEVLLATYLNLSGYSSKNQELYNFVQSHLNSDYYKVMLKHIKSKSEINVSSYVLVDTLKRNISLANFSGKVILLDIWGTGCGACILYRNNVLSKIDQEFKGNNKFQIITINIDKNFETWRKSLYLNTYADPKGINLFTNGLNNHHPLNKDLGLYETPSTILINKDGMVIDNNSYRLDDAALLSDLIKEYL